MSSLQNLHAARQGSLFGKKKFKNDEEELKEIEEMNAKVFREGANPDVFEYARMAAKRKLNLKTGGKTRRRKSKRKQRKTRRR